MKHRNTDSMDRIIGFVNDWYREHHASPSGRKIAAGTGIPLTTVQRMLKTMAEDGRISFDGQNVVTELSNKGSEETIPVGIIGSIPCGNLTLEEEAIEEIVQLPTSLFGKGELFLLHASGDSMTGAGIDDGDLVLIRKQEEARNGDIVVAFIEGEGNTLKRYKRYGHTVFLHPENPKYTDIPLKDCKIQGVAVSVIKQL
jgi:repressor LexA